MTSNTPPPITPNINTNPDSSQDANNRPQVNVVTQPSQLTQEFDLISTPAQQRNSQDIDDHHEDFQLEHLLEHCNSTHTPIMAESAIPHYPTPTNASPDTSRKRIHSVMELTTMENAERADAARVMVAMGSNSNKKTFNPKKTMLTFLRDDDIDRHKSLLKAKGKPTINTRSTLTVAKRRFQRIEKEVQTMNDKFKALNRSWLYATWWMGYSSSSWNKRAEKHFIS
jgi:hypothetical protein